MSFTSRFILVWLLLPFAGCSSSGSFTLWPPNFPLLTQTKQIAAETPIAGCLSRELNKQPIREYYLEPGDRILIEPVQMETQLRVIGDQEVQVDGSIDLGEFGRIRIAGMTAEMAEAAIVNQLSLAGGKAEPINVQLVETNAALYYVLGEVGSPGAYELEGRELVLDGILKAGGLTTQASPCNIILVRPTEPCDQRVVLPVCYRQITQLGNTGTNYQLQPGDRIVVASRTFCEELAIWKQSRPCKFCNCEQCPEKQPCSVNYKNRFMRWLPPFPLPGKSGDDPEEIPAAEAAPTRMPEPSAPLERSPSAAGDQEQQEQNEDYFLPSISKPEQ